MGSLTHSCGYKLIYSPQELHAIVMHNGMHSWHSILILTRSLTFFLVAFFPHIHWACIYNFVQVLKKQFLRNVNNSLRYVHDEYENSYLRKIHVLQKQSCCKRYRGNKQNRDYSKSVNTSISDKVMCIMQNPSEVCIECFFTPTILICS